MMKHKCKECIIYDLCIYRQLRVITTPQTPKLEKSILKKKCYEILVGPVGRVGLDKENRNQPYNEWNGCLF